MSTNSLKKVQLTPAMIHAIGAALTLAVALAFYLGFYAPASADVAERTDRMEQLHMLMGTSEKVGRDHRQLQERLDALRQAAASNRKRMPRRPSTEAYIENITQLATNEGLEVEICSAAAPQSFKTHTQVEVACRLKGRYASVCQFLAGVDQLSQISKVSTFEIDTATNSDAYPVHVTFQLYYRAEVNDTQVRQRTP